MLPPRPRRPFRPRREQGSVVPACEELFYVVLTTVNIGEMHLSDKKGCCRVTCRSNSMKQGRFGRKKKKRKCHIWTCKSTNLQSQLFLESMEKTTLRFWHIFGKNREHRFTRRPLENLCFFFAGKRQLPRKGKLPPTIFFQKISQPGAFCFTSCRAMFQGLLLGALRNFVLSKEACTKCSLSRGGPATAP